MEVILATAYCILFYYIISRNSFFSIDSFPHASPERSRRASPERSRRVPQILFVIKCLAGISLGIIYTKYYTNQNDTDTFKFFTDSKIMFDALYSATWNFFRMFTGIDGDAKELLPYYEEMNSWLNKNPFYNDNRTIVRLNVFFRFFSLGYYNVHVIFMNFISFTGIFCLYKTFVSYCPQKKNELLILTFLLPSVLFWGSGVLKDGIMLTGFGMSVYGFNQILKSGFTLRRMLLFTSGMIILMLTKVYVLALLIPGFFAWWISNNSSSKKIAITFLAAYTIYFVTAFNLYHFFPDYNIAALIFYKQKNFLDLGQIQDATMISIPYFECSAPGIMKASPHAFANTMFRPFLSDVNGNLMIFLSAMENLLILILIAICILTFSARGKRLEPLIMLSILFVVLLFILIGLISPVLGAIVRYKIVALPMLMFIIVYYYDRDKLFRLFPFLQRSKTTKKD